ncbi:PmoA family protein [Akkermansiaceae bacterium]|nr:PmoA family protein [Akkermansiaceae bacterium]
MKMHAPRIAAAIALAISAPAAKAEFSFARTDGTLQLLDGGKLITSFRTDYRVPYLYPLTAPSGANILRHWPMEKDAPSEEKDHPHHRGVWLSHGNVNGYDFWAGTGNKDASIKEKSIYGEKVENGVASFNADLYWSVDGAAAILTEDRRHFISRPDADTLRIDISSRLTARNGDVVFGDTKEGTFAIRTDRTLRVKGKEAKATLTNSNGETDLDAWGKRATWPPTPAPDELGKPVVVAILDDPSSFRHPTHWHARDYGLLAANPFGIHDFEKNKDKKAGNHVLKKGESIMLKYTVIIHSGSLESAKLDEIHRSLSSKP